MKIIVAGVAVAIALALAGCSTHAPEIVYVPAAPVVSPTMEPPAPAPLASAPAARHDEYQYTVTGNTDTASITWTDGSASQQQATAAHLPWHATEQTGGFAYEILAQDLHGTTITCTISDNGVVLKRVTSTGKYAIAMCVYAPNN